MFSFLTRYLSTLTPALRGKQYYVTLGQIVVAARLTLGSPGSIHKASVHGPLRLEQVTLTGTLLCLSNKSQYVSQNSLILWVLVNIRLAQQICSTHTPASTFTTHGRHH